MSGLFILLFLLSLFALVAGLVRPGFFSRLRIYGRKRVGLIFGIAAFVFVILAGATAEPLPKEQKSEIEPTVTEAVSTPVVTSETQTQQVTQQQMSTVLVTRVIDGDTIEIEGGQRIRYIGIDTPETVDPRKPVQCFGREASDKNKTLVGGKRVRLEQDITNTDRYGRLLRYVYVDDLFVNLKLVVEGFAFSYTYPPDVKYQPQFIEAERLAREQKNGLWGSCPITSTPGQSVMPEQITPPAQTVPEQNSCSIKGNISSKGEKIYHVPGCGSYSKTVIDESKGERWFCSESEAVSSGWRKALNCP